MKFIQFGHGILITLVMLALASASYGQSEDKITIFVDDSYPPYMYKLEGTQAEGLYPRLLEKITREAGYKVEIKAYPWSRALLAGAAGKGAIGGAYKNNERLEVYDYSTPLFQEKLVLFVNKDNQFKFNDIEDLKGKVIGVNRGWSYGQEFDAAKAKNLFEVNVRKSPEENFQMLALGRIDCLILDKHSGESYLRILGISDKITVLPKDFSNNNGYLIISKQLKMTNFLNKFNATLEKLQSNGTYNDIVQKFVQDSFTN